MTDDLAIPAFLERTKNKPLVGTFTMMNCYENTCPHQAYHIYVAKTVPWIATPEKDWGNLVHSAFEHRVGGGKPLPTNVQKWDKDTKEFYPFNMQEWEPFASAFDGYKVQVEQKIALTAQGQSCSYTDNNARYRTKIDVALVNGETAYVADWKTGGSKYEDPFELEVQAMHLHAKHPQLKKITGNFVWLREGRMGQPYDLSNTLAAWTKANDIMARMEAARVENNWPKRKSGLCGWCDVKTCEHNTKRD